MFLSLRKKLVHLSLFKPLLSYEFFKEIIEYIRCYWNDRKKFFSWIFFRLSKIEPEPEMALWLYCYIKLEVKKMDKLLDKFYEKLELKFATRIFLIHCESVTGQRLVLCADKEAQREDIRWWLKKLIWICKVYIWKGL